MKRIDYFFPRQLLLFTTGFFFSQLALSGTLMQVSGIAWGLSVLWVLGVIMWNAWIGYKTENNK